MHTGGQYTACAWKENIKTETGDQENPYVTKIDPEAVSDKHRMWIPDQQQRLASYPASQPGHQCVCSGQEEWRSAMEINVKITLTISYCSAITIFL